MAINILGRTLDRQSSHFQLIASLQKTLQGRRWMFFVSSGKRKASSGNFQQLCTLVFERSKDKDNLLKYSILCTVLEGS
jgi:hypothetical protein